MSDQPQTDSMLAFLDNESIFSVEPEGEGFRFWDESDSYFSAYLTKDQMITLGCEILAMAGCQVNVEGK